MNFIRITIVFIIVAVISCNDNQSFNAQTKGKMLNILSHAELMLSLNCGLRFFHSIKPSENWIDVSDEFNSMIRCYQKELDTEFPMIVNGIIVDLHNKPISINAKITDELIVIKLSTRSGHEAIEVQKEYRIAIIGSFEK